MREQRDVYISSFILSFLCLITLTMSYLMIPTPSWEYLGDSTTAWRRMGILPAIMVALGVGGASVFAINPRSKPEHVLHISVIWAVMIGMGHQIGLSTPIGSDGWYFVELTSRFSEFGFDPQINSYLMRPGALLLLLIASFFPFISIPIAAVGFGLIVAYLTTYIVLSHILSRNREWKIALPFIAVGWAGLVTTIGDLFDYEAHSLAVLLLFFFWYRLSIAHHRLASILVITCLCLTHTFIPLILIFSLFIQWCRDGDISKRNIGLIGLWIWCGWALFTFETTSLVLFSFLETQPSGGIFAVGVVAITAIIVLLGYLFVPEGRDRRSVEHVDMISMLLAIVIFAPIFLYKDFSHDTIGFSFTKRIFLYMFPSLIASLFSTINAHVASHLDPARVGMVRALFISYLLLPITAGFIHHRWVGRDFHFQPDTENCWEMVSENGYGDVSILGNGVFFLHSPRLVPPEPTNWVYSYIDPYDNDHLPHRAGNIVIVLETPDIPDSLAREGLTDEVNYSDWTLMDEVKGACRLWVDPEVAAQYQ